jgi:hypothetical protein
LETGRESAYVVRMPNLRSAPPLVLACLLAGLLAPLPGCKQFKDSYSEGFKKSYQTNFSTSCTNAAVANGAPQAKVKPYCECMAKHLVDHHDSIALTKLSADTEGPESKKALEEAGRACEGSMGKAM